MSKANNSAVPAAERLRKQAIGRRKYRETLDCAATATISLGGIGILATLVMLLAYLIYVVRPLFVPAEIAHVATFSATPSQAMRLSPVLLSIDERSEFVLRLDQSGQFSLIDLGSEAIVQTSRLPVAQSAEVSAVALSTGERTMMAIGLNSGEVLLVSAEYDSAARPEAGARDVSPLHSYPFGRLPLFTMSEPVSGLAISQQGDEIQVVAVGANGQIELATGKRQSSLTALLNPSSVPEYEWTVAISEAHVSGASRVFIDGDHQHVFALDSDGRLIAFSIRGLHEGGAESFSSDAIANQPGKVVDAEMLVGGRSLMIADDLGQIGQWFFDVRSGELLLHQARVFLAAQVPLHLLESEQRHKNIGAVDIDGVFRLFNTTADRLLAEQALVGEGIAAMTISPRGDLLLTESESGQFLTYQIDSPHPEISWSALWKRVWYEGYPDPAFVWQSSASGNVYEPKYSLMPLTFGTLKAAFYAMLLAAPLAVCGAIFTGYFMAPGMRRTVKPLVELMEALPSVVLGFLAGLWLAPFVEKNLLGVFVLVILLPVTILTASVAWMFFPRRLRHSIPEGWEAALLVPVIILISWFAIWVAGPFEFWLFGGDIKAWLGSELGLAYDQRNAMIVGFAMGFAVIPTIFSIAEDAIFTVPRQLSNGSLALGATPWQTLAKVILPMASPGIFSALMIGFGRAVGETMIVLMATGNTPIMDINIFEGMRTLAANIAVEVPETDVNGSHYRVLFLSALVLFAFTFLVNTIAELVRQRLRRRYSLI